MADAPPTLPTPSARTVTFDALKGIGIIEVVFHHCTGRSLWKFETKLAPGWWIAVVANEILHFAVPLFLFVSALLLSRQFAKGISLSDYFRRRFTRTLIPYLVATIGYLAFRVFVMHTEGEIRPEWYGRIFWPAIAFGRGYFHLYFIIVLLQLVMMIPLLCAIHKKFELTFLRWCLVGTAVYVAFVICNGWAFTMSTPGSLLVTYAVPVALGLGFGLSPPKELWSARALGWIVLLTGALHVYLATGVAVGMRLPTWLVAFAFTGYTASFSVWIWQVVEAKREMNWVKLIGKAGAASMAIYLLHPLAMHYVGGPRLTTIYQKLPFSSVWFTAATLAVTLGAIFGYRAIVGRFRTAKT